MATIHKAWRVPTLLLVLAIGSGLLAQSDEDLGASITQSFQFSAIRIPVWVAKGGVPIEGLEIEDFELRVDQRPAKIEQVIRTQDRPMELVYLLDLSGSMEIGGKLKGSIEAVDYLISRHRPEDRWQLCVFADEQVVKVLTQDTKEKWDELVPKLRAYGKTALYDALFVANSYFTADSLASRAVLLFTDGHDNQSLMSEDQVVEVLKKLDAPVFSIAIADGFVAEAGSEEEPLALDTLRRISQTTGGSLFIAKDVGQLAVISRSLAQKMRPQYMLTITVERGASDKRHRLDVRVLRSKKYQLRYRKGYTGSLPEFLGGD